MKQKAVISSRGLHYSREGCTRTRKDAQDICEGTLTGDGQTDGPSSVLDPSSAARVLPWELQGEKTRCSRVQVSPVLLLQLQAPWGSSSRRGKMRRRCKHLLGAHALSTRQPAVTPVAANTEEGAHVPNESRHAASE